MPSSLLFRSFFFLIPRPPPRSTLFPYTTLFRSTSLPTTEAICRTRLSSRGSRSIRADSRSEEHTSELQSLRHLVCRLLLEKKKRILKQRIERAVEGR